jgi:hypothetical protein
LGIEGFFELVFSSYLSVSGGIISTDGEILGIILSYLCISIALVFLPGAIVMVARMSKE